MTVTPALARFGLDPRAMSFKPMKVDQSVAEELKALAANRAIIIPGRMNGIKRAILLGDLTRSMMMKMLEKRPSMVSLDKGNVA